MPFDHGLSPLTLRSRPTHYFGNTPSFTDILDGKMDQFHNDINSRDAPWGARRDRSDVNYHYRDQADDFMMEDKIRKSIQDMLGSKNNREVWIIETPDGHKVEYPSQGAAQKDVRDGKIRVKRMFMMVRKAQVEEGPHPFVETALQASFMTQALMSDGVELGAAFCVGPRKFMTCAHCVQRYNRRNPPSEPDQRILVTLQRQDKTAKARILKVDFIKDIALIEADITCPVLEMETGEFHVGDEVFVVGSPKGFENNVSDGIVSSLDRKLYYHDDAPSFIFTDAQILPGNSGGPLLSHNSGNVVGMIQLIVAPEGYVGLNAAISVEYLNIFLQDKVE